MAPVPPFTHLPGRLGKPLREVAHHVFGRRSWPAALHVHIALIVGGGGSTRRETTRAGSIARANTPAGPRRPCTSSGECEPRAGSGMRRCGRGCAPRPVPPADRPGAKSRAHPARPIGVAAAHGCPRRCSRPIRAFGVIARDGDAVKGRGARIEDAAALPGFARLAERPPSHAPGADIK
jgi:hypothetical protein